jgi:hypothetical protein
VRPDLVANLDALDGHCAVFGLDRRASLRYTSDSSLSIRFHAL